MGELRTKLDQLSAEIESFVSEVTGQIQAAQSELETLTTEGMGPLQAIPPEIQSVLAEINAQVEALESELDLLTT